MVASNIGIQKTNTIIEKLDQMDAKYDAFITAVLTSNEEEFGKD